ncbi:MAG TPA: Smr/MutS family protein [Polyangiaceae bacterium]|nr:Smr/MutS family protein [Polyangiaceae bacterium]
MTTDAAPSSALLPSALELDAETRAALEWPALLAALGGFCTSPSGKARALALHPAAELEAARARNQIVSEMLDLDRLGLAPAARAFPDVTHAVELAARGGVASAAELWQVRELLEVSAKLRVFARGQRESHPALSQAIDSPSELDGLEEDLVHSLDADGTVADRASPELARARKRVRELRDEMKRKLGQLIERHADVVQGEYYTEREGRYVLPVRADAHLRVPGIVLGSSASGATLFVEPQEMTGLGNQLRIQEAEALREAAKVLTQLSGYLASDAEHVRAAQRACEEADVLSALARFARQTRSIIVPLSDEARLDLRTARHPLLALSSQAVVANDIAIEAGRALVISGPNAGGKTVALKTLGLVAWMARAGIPLPVAEESKVGWFGSVLADIGDEQSIARSLSTFSAHVQRLCFLLEQAAGDTLILLDELASGTDPEEGAALAAAVLEALTARGAAVGITTHYEKLKEFAAHAAHLQNASVSYDFERMAPTFRLTMGVPGASSALTVATRHGLPSSVVARAQALLPEQSVERERAVERLERQRQSFEEEREALAREAEELRQLRARMEAEHEDERAALEAEVERETVALRANVSKIRAELLAARERLKKEAQDPKALRSIERDLGRAAVHVSLGGSLLPRPEASDARPSALRAPAITYKGGDSVRVKSSGLLATVIDASDDKLRIQVGSIKLILRSEDVESARAPKNRAKPARAAKSNLVSSALPTAVRTSSNTLNLIGERVDGALDKLDAFLDRMLSSGEPLGFVLHGHGTGALKSAVRAHLQASSYIEQSQPADADSGGDAFTIFWLRC